jgi:hypothetical protein
MKGIPVVLETGHPLGMERSCMRLLPVCLVLSQTVSLVAAWSSVDLRVGPYLQNFTPNSITVMWETTQSVKGWVEYGHSIELGTRVDGAETATHEVEISGLEPATRYYYKVAWEGGESAVTWLKTAPPIGHRNLRLVAYGDSRSDPETHSKIVSRIKEVNPDFVINSGDLVQNGKVYEQWKPQFFDPLQPLIQNVCLFTLLGNHEGNAPEYYNYLCLPKNGGNEAWWSTDIGNIHLVGLDSNTSFNASSPGSPQYEWLKKDLASTRQEWTVVCFHHPLFSFHPTRGINETRWDWQPLFQEMGVDLVLVGHDHQYGRTFPIGPFTNDPAKGVVHITSGGGGANLYPVHDFGYSSARRATYNLVVFDVEGDRMIGRALDHLGNGLDSFVIDKKTPVSPETFISYEMMVLEQEISDTLGKVQPDALEEDTKNLEYTLQSSVVFGSTVTATILPRGDSDWQLTTKPSLAVLPPGEPLRMELSAAREKRDQPVFPLPEMTLHVAADASNRDFRAPVLGFRNTDIELMPFRVSVPTYLSLPPAQTDPQINGVANEEAWKSAQPLAAFFETKTTRTPHQGTTARVLRSSKGNLLVSAEMTQSPAKVADQPYDREDDLYLERNEYFAVRLSDGNKVWTFLVCPNGNGADIEGGDTKWDAEGYTFAAKPSEKGWTAEMEIPSQVFPTPLIQLGINLVRFDLANMEISEWVPSYGKGRDAHGLYAKFSQN